MARFKLDHPPLPGTTAFGLLTDARACLSSAGVLIASGDASLLKPKFDLLCHSFELALKACLAIFDVNEDALNVRYGHKLESVLNACIANGDISSDIRMRHLVFNIDVFYQGRAFRCSGNKITILLYETEFQDVIEVLVKNINSQIIKTYFLS